MSSSQQYDQEYLLEDFLEPDGPSELYENPPEDVLIRDREAELRPSDLGSLLETARETSVPLYVETDVDWFPGTDRTLTEYFEGNVLGKLESLLMELLHFEDGEPRDSIRSLMQACDELMESLTAEPEAVEELDSRLWSWFQDPPEPEKLREELNEILQNVLAGRLLGDGPEEQPTGQTTSEPTQEVESEEETSEVDSAESTGELTEEPTERPEDSNGSPDEVFSRELDADPTMVEDFLKEANQHLNQLDNLLVEAEKDPTADTLGELFRSMHTLKGGFGFCGLERCTDITHAAEDLLDVLKEDPPADMPAVWMDLFFDTLDTIRTICTALEEAVDEESSVLSADVHPEYLRLLESDLRKACDGETDESEFESLDFGAGDGQEEELQDQELGEETVSIELGRIGELVDLIGELVISHSALQEQLNGELDRQIENSLNKQEKILDQLQRRSMNLRMLPVKKEFDKFPRIVRDLSRELDKEINLEVEGADTEIDKSVLDALHGPLVHLVRNACDHGLETPEERRNNGKDPEGTLCLRAYHESGNVYLEVEDDGAGLNRTGIESKAIERGIIDEDHDLSDEEIDELIFHQGFSTTEEVSDVSGRGVGMDVVASEIEKLRGSIAIDSTPGEGTKLTIELPLTVAIIDGLIARLGEERMIFPVSQVVESINPSDEDLRSVQGQGKVVQVRDDVIPYVEPAEFIDGVSAPDGFDDRTILVLVRSHSGQFAVRVDELISHQQVVIKSLEGYSLEQNELVSGGAILGDGTVGLILDVPGMVRAYRQGTKDAVAQKK